MKAVIKSGGKQYIVEEGTKVDVEKLKGEVGDAVNFSDILMVYDSKDAHIGTPTLKEATVKGEIVSQYKDQKVIILKFKRRKRYSKKQGHRQQKTQVQIKEINIKATAKTTQTKKEEKPTTKAS